MQLPGEMEITWGVRMIALSRPCPTEMQLFPFTSLTSFFLHHRSYILLTFHNNLQYIRLSELHILSAQDMYKIQ